MLKFKKSYLIFTLHIIILIISFYLYQKYYPTIHPLSSTNFQITSEQATQLAQKFIGEDIPKEELKTRKEFFINEDYYQINSGRYSFLSNYKLQQYCYWEITMKSRMDEDLNLTLGSGNNSSTEDLESTFYVSRISPEGRVLRLNFENARLELLRDSLKGKHPIENDSVHALKIIKKQALQYLKEIVGNTRSLNYVTSEIKEDSIVKVYNLTFSEKIEDKIVLHKIKISNNVLLYYDMTFEQEDIVVHESKINKTIHTILGILSGIIYLGLIILLLVYLIIFARKDAISFKMALPIMYFIGIITFLQALFETWNTSWWNIAIGVIFPTLIFSAAVLLLYSLADALVRQQWSSKLVITDQFLQGYFFSRTTGFGIFRGVYLGILSSSIYGLLLYFHNKILGSSLSIDGDLSYSLFIIFPAFSLILMYLLKSVFNEFFFRLFALSLIKRWFKKNVWVIVVGLLLGLVLSTEIQAKNPTLNFFYCLIPTFLFTYFFIKFDIFTTIIGYFFYLTLPQAVIFTKTNEIYFHNLGIGFYFLLILLFLFGLVTIILKQNHSEKQYKYIPDYIRKMEEKERLQKELEIARNIQKKFLPDFTPNIPNYDIAAFCQPAWEVGGDYFDFFSMKDNKLGVIIGDVSNKGVSAAFFMTLVKGFLKALTRHYQKPIDILSETNRLFYENVERSYFISMIFGVLDIDSGLFTYSRAGHNPLLLLVDQSRDEKWLTPSGVGIGMLPHDKFKKTITEESIRMQTNDTMVFYTDGYSESMNDQGDEFGEENLKNIISKYKKNSAETIIKELEKAILNWQGKRPAIDDRTIVVIKRIK